MRWSKLKRRRRQGQDMHLSKRMCTSGGVHEVPAPIDGVFLHAHPIEEAHPQFVSAVLVVDLTCCGEGGERAAAGHAGKVAGKGTRKCVFNDSNSNGHASSDGRTRMPAIRLVRSYSLTCLHASVSPTPLYIASTSPHCTSTAHTAPMTLKLKRAFAQPQAFLNRKPRG